MAFPYVAANYSLWKLVAGTGFLRWALFLSCVYNPFIMDYLVAARGYGLALGFLAIAFFLFSRRVLREDGASERKILREAIWISTFAGLAICASFPFAYASGFF